MLSCMITKSETATGKVEFEYTGFYTRGGERIDAFIYVGVRQELINVSSQ